MLKMEKRTVCVLAAMTLVGCLAGCAPQVSSDGNGKTGQADESAESAIAEVSFSQNSDCAMCHTVETASISDPSCLVGQPSHSSMECLACHEYNGDLEKAHAKVSAGDTPRKNLKRTKVDESVCMACHDVNDLAEKTSSITALTDTKGTTVNPHEVMTMGSGHDEIMCSSCHKMHSSEGAEGTAANLCLSCHHSEVYECGTCH